MIKTNEIVTNNKPPVWQKIQAWLIDPSASIVEIGMRRQAQISAALSLALTLSIVLSITTTLSGPLTTNDIVRFGTLIPFLFSYFISRTRYYRIGGWIMVLALALPPFFIASLGQEGTDNLGRWLLSFESLAYVIAILLLTPLGFAIVVIVTTVATFILPGIFPYITGAETGAAGGIMITLGGLLYINAIVQRNAERTRLSELRQTNEELNVLRSSLESRVAERTNALAVSSRISRRLSTILDPAQLVLAVVEQVKTAFDYYHVHIYFLDEGGQKLKMMGGTGEAGQMMLQEGHSIPLEKGLVGRAARLNQVVLVADTDMEPGWLSNPLLPETKSELAIPIAFGEMMIGVLDVQHNVVNGLTEDDADLLQSIANQVAIALQNARQYAQAQESEGRLRAMIDAIPTGVLITRIKDGLVQYANDIAAALFAYPLETLIGNTTPNLYYNTSDREMVLNILRREGRLSNHEVLGRRQDGSSVWVALSVQTMIYAGEPSFFINATDITERKQTAEALTKRAEHDRVFNRISTKIRGAVSVEQILQIATQELRQATGASRSVVEITPIEQKTVEFSRD